MNLKTLTVTQPSLIRYTKMYRLRFILSNFKAFLNCICFCSSVLKLFIQCLFSTKFRNKISVKRSFCLFKTILSKFAYFSRHGKCLGVCRVHCLFSVSHFVIQLGVCFFFILAVFVFIFLRWILYFLRKKYNGLMLAKILCIFYYKPFLITLKLLGSATSSIYFFYT